MPEPPFAGFWSLFLDSFKDPIQLILVGAAAVSFAVGLSENLQHGWIDGAAIAFAILLVCDCVRVCLCVCMLCAHATGLLCVDTIILFAGCLCQRWQQLQQGVAVPLAAQRRERHGTRFCSLSCNDAWRMCSNGS